MQAKASSTLLSAPFSPKLVVWIAFAVFAFLFTAGFIGYIGSKFIYLLFTASFSTLLLSGIYYPSTYSYLFLTIFLWLGFWFKFTANFLLLGYFPFEEPVGYFLESASGWDHALWIAIAGSTAVMFARLLYKFTKFGSTVVIRKKIIPPIWYSHFRSWLWIVLIASIIGLALLNGIYGIQQSGLVPRTRLYWPLNAVTYWLLSTGFSMAAATFLWWDIGLKKNLVIPVYAILAEALFSTVSLLSRSVYLFHVIPQLLAVIVNRGSIFSMPKKNAILIVVVFFILFVGSVISVSLLRDVYYSPKIDSIASIDKLPASYSKNELAATSSIRLKLLHQLIINRWIGIEGALAVSSYPQKSPALFFNALMAQSSIDNVDVYQKISNSAYQEVDGSKYQFASLPGATAFLYYSGSAWYVIFGMFFLTFIAMSSERLILLMTGNITLCALCGLNFANAIAQLGVTPRQLLPHLGMIAGVIIIIWIIQLPVFNRFVTKFSVNKS